MGHKKKEPKGAKAAKKALLSDRQRHVLLIVLAVLLLAVPVVENIRCKAACMQRVKTPYPEIACGYECPWPWQKSR
jgi:hypothetical protein